MRRRLFKGYGRKAVSATAAVAIAASMSVSPAMIQAAFADSVATDTDKYVTVSAYRAAEPAPEILGLNSVSTNTAWGKMGVLNWSSPYYYFFGTSEYNSNPNPWMVNTVANAEAGEEGKYTPAMVEEEKRDKGPIGSILAYTASENAAKVWDQLPDIILGNHLKSNYNSADYAQAAAEAKGVSDYKTYGTDGGDYGVEYNPTNIYTMIDSMWNLSSAAKAAEEGTGKTTRYGDTDEIVADFESYVKGIQGYILKRLDDGKASKKKVALVYSYDSETSTYQIIPTGVSEGSASANRYLEAVQNVAVNIADDGRETKTVGTGQNTTTYVTATKDEVEACDLILVGSQAGNETLSNTESIVASMSETAQDKAYWVNSSNGSAGSCYGVVMNSVENAQNIGRILGCLYSEYVDQSDMIAYYYQHFYHLNTDKLDEAIDNAMDGVRNWNAAGSSQSSTSWSTSDVADYDEGTVAAILDEGVSYITSGKTDVSLLSMTSNYTTTVGKSSGTKLSLTTLGDKIAAVTYTGSAIEPAVTISYKDTELKEGEDYNVSYSNNTNVGVGYVKLTAVEGSAYTGSRTIAFKINPLGSLADATVKVSNVTYNGKAQKPAVTVSYDGKTLVQGTDYTVSYSNNTAAGKATVKVTALDTAGYTGSKTATFTISKASQSIKVSTATKSVKYKSLKKKAQVTSKVKVTGAKGTVTYAKVSGSKKLSINKKTGKITVKKGTKKGTYTIKVKATSAKTSSYNAVSKTVTIKVKVK